MNIPQTEIGGYFGLETFTGTAYYENLIPLNNARNALVYILKARNIKKIYIPAFLCDSVRLSAERENVETEEYSVNADFLPDFERMPGENEYVYIVNYYGFLENDQILALKRKYGRIILDNVQAFFARPLPGIDTVYSCRKFFGVPDGGYASTDAVYAGELPRDRSAGRMKHILGRFEENASDYYGDFQKNDESFYGLEMMQMSKVTENILRGIDYEKVAAKRNENYALLNALLQSKNLLGAKTAPGPYAYPLLTENGPEIRRALAQKKIYIPTLWPNVISSPNASETEKNFARNILPLPCDQRYGKSEMQYMAEEILRIVK